MSLSVLSPFPEGFVAAIDILEQLPAKVVQRMTAGVVDTLARRPSVFSLEALHKVLSHKVPQEGDSQRSTHAAVAVQELRERTAAATALTELQQGMRALDHVLRTAVDKRVSPEKLGAALRGVAAVDGAVYGALLPLWEQAAPTLLGGDAQPMPLIPTVTDFDWRVGVTVQPEAGGSGEGDMTESYVEFQLYCVMPDGSKAVQPFQIPVNEFQDFAKEIDSLARVTSTI